MAAVLPIRFSESGSLYRPGFDAALVIGLPLLALLTTLLVLWRRDWLPVVLALDLWLLGYQHVIATYTRTAFDRDSFRRHWTLNLLLPPFVLLTTLGVALSSESAVLWLTSVYLHWQLFHYVRQSEGISKAYAGKGGRRPSLTTNTACRASFYAFPTTAFLTMAAQGQTQFLGFPVWLPRLSDGALMLCWVVTVALFTLAAQRTVAAFRRGELTTQHLGFLLSHYLVFGIAYAGIRDIALSWLMANIWHNGQYLAFVWAQNQQRFNDQIDTRHRLLSTLCLSRNLALYVSFCMAITVVIYTCALWIQQPLTQLTGLSGLAIAAVVYQSINFHHYIVDAIIWRRPKPKAALQTAAR